MRKLHRCAIFGVLGVAACAGVSDIGESQQAAMNLNSMNPAALNPSSAGGVDPRALSAAALDPDQLGSAAAQALKDPGTGGDLTRQLVKYAVGCAFTADMSFDFTWKDADGNVQHDSYPGLLGLAPDWAAGPLNSTEQQWVSACLASRVNATGATVELSSRGKNAALATTADERSYYSTREAAWFGNIFASPQYVYACYDPVTSTLAQLQRRVCGNNGSLLSLLLNGLQTYDCGPIVVMGPCLNLLNLLALGPCKWQQSGDNYYFGCSNPWGLGLPSITTFVHGPIPW